MNIIVDLNYPIKDGTEVVFRSPVDCSQVKGLLVNYQENGVTESKEFVLADAHGNNVGDIVHLFAENVAVKVILDVTTGMAFVQNADTNAYLEGRFAELEAKTGIVPIKGKELDSLAASGELVVGTFYLTTTDYIGWAYVDAPAGTLYLATGTGTLEKQVQLRGASVQAITGENLDELACIGQLVIGDLYFVVSDFLDGEKINSYKGTLWKATANSRAEVLSWIRDGEPGKDGYTPVRGTDYWTEADKAEITQSVLAALPNGDEVSY